MLIDLHAHLSHPDMLHQHEHWGPFREFYAGAYNLRVGKWRLALSTKEVLANRKKGAESESLESMQARRADPAYRIHQMDAAGQDIQVISLPFHLTMYQTEKEFSARYARHVNELMARYCSAYPDRLYFWAHAPLNDPDAALKEIDHAIGELGAKGLSMGGANLGGLELDDEALYPVWEKMCDYDLPLFVHGYNQSLAWGDRADQERYEITTIVGMMHDETAAFWNLICGGVLDRFPDLKVYITHGGGYVPYHLGRFEATNANLPTVKNKKPVRDYLGNFYFDLLTHETPMRQAILDVIGADRLLYGTNFAGSDTVREMLTDGIRISDEDRAKIEGINAMKLLRIPPVTSVAARERPKSPVDLHL